MSVERHPFGTTKDGREVDVFTLRCGAMEAEILTYGGIVRTLRAPDKNGQSVDVVLGYDSVAGYEENDGYVGALVGRYANRIQNANAIIDGANITLDANEGIKQLHGGPDGFSFKVFKAEIAGESAVRLIYTAADGEGGFPGTLTLAATYTLTENALILRYEAESDKPTYCNITNHSYFNLNGCGDVLGHTLWLNASRFTPIDADSIPIALSTGVAGTAFDFTVPTTIGQDVLDNEAQLRLAKGYDHNFILNEGQGMRLAARLEGEISGIVMETWTEKPGVQVYSANYLDAERHTKSGAPYRKRDALCLETQFFPDSPNHPEWGDIILRPGKRYDYTTDYRFFAERP